MEMAFSALPGELAQRSISFFIQKISKEVSPVSSCDMILRRKLLQVRIIVEEAEGRQIRNQAMLEQLKVLQIGMHRGYYVLDTFKYGAYQQEDNGKDVDGVVSFSFALSKFNPAKRIQLRAGSSQGGEELHQVVGSLEIMITDSREFIMFLKSCPPLYRRMHSTYLVMEKCMFGRHIEMEHIINFLTQKIYHGNLDVLPIVGPAKSGKSTLVEHACNEERLRSAFSQIFLFREDDLDKQVMSVRNGGTVKYLKYTLDREEKSLAIIDLNGDIDEATWTNLCSAFKKYYTTTDSKVIICSRSFKVARFGTARALKVEYLTREAYWYFFKSLAFGSTDPKDEPKLVPVAMKMAMYLNGSFICGNIIASMLRASLKFWRIALLCVKEVSQIYPFVFGAHTVSPLQDTLQAYVRKVDGSSEYCLVSSDYKTAFAPDEAQTMITFQEVLSGSVIPCGKFDVLAWRSSIPPHYSYIFRCEIHKASELDVRQKQILKRIC